MIQYTDVVVDYLADPSNLFPFMTKGLTGIQEWVRVVPESRFLQKVLTSNDPIFMQVALHAKLLRELKRCNLVGDCLNFIKMYNRSLISYKVAHHLDPVELYSSFLEYLRSIVQYIHDRRMPRTDAVETSVITGCSIIAPYVGTLKKPFDNLYVNEDKDETVSTDSLSMSSYNAQMVRDKALAGMKEIWMSHAAMDNLLTNASMLLDVSEKDTDMANLIHLYQIGKEGDNAPIFTYYTWAYLYANADKLDDPVISKLIMASSDIHQVSFQDLYNTYVDATPADESALLSELDTLDTLSKYMKRPERYLKTDTSTDPLSLFNLTGLMNYLYTNRRFRSNDYVRSRFMTMERVANYTLYRGFFLIIPQKDNGENTDYLYVPVIDDLNGSQVAIIKYWRNGEIEILTENQYYDEIGSMV